MHIDRDVRDILFCDLKCKKYLVRITAQSDGIISGIHWVRKACQTLGIRVRKCKKDGDRVRRLETVAVLEGNPKQITQGEDELVGWIAKASGIATAARKAAIEGQKLKVVSGAWKKMPVTIKPLIRQAVLDGGIQYRISEHPFIYLDKNYIKILGGVRKAIRCIEKLEPLTKVIQLKSRGLTLLKESAVAAKLGANIIMIDTGEMGDIDSVDRLLKKQGLRKKVKLAFGGGIKLEDLKNLRTMPVDIVDIGKAIIDAPLLDMRMDVVGAA